MPMKVAAIMAEFLWAAATLLTLIVGLGLLRLLRGPADNERLMATQLLGTGAVATLLLLAVASGESAVLDVALTLALLAAFAGFAFVKAQSKSAQEDGRLGQEEQQP